MEGKKLLNINLSRNKIKNYKIVGVSSIIIGLVTILLIMIRFYNQGLIDGKTHGILYLVHLKFYEWLSLLLLSLILLITGIFHYLKSDIAIYLYKIYILGIIINRIIVLLYFKNAIWHSVFVDIELPIIYSIIILVIIGRKILYGSTISNIIIIILSFIINIFFLIK